MQTPSHKVIITGTGRAGTTFLVRLFTELGLDTGYTKDNWQRDYFSHCNAGLERELNDPAGPYIVKNPGLCETLERDLVSKQVAIDLAIIPVRDLDSAASSRIRVGGGNGVVPGGLLGTSDPAHQKAVLAELFHRLVYTLVSHDIPYTFLLFPRFVEDAGYAYERLKPVLGKIDQAEFEAVFARVAEPKLVHTFKPGVTVATTDLSGFQATQRHKRKLRRVRNYAAWFALAACFAFAIGSRWPASAMGNPKVHPALSSALVIPAVSTASTALPEFSVEHDRISTSGFPGSGIEQSFTRLHRPTQLTPLLSHLPAQSHAVATETPSGGPIESPAESATSKLVTGSP